VSVDLEWIQPDFASEEIAERFFTGGEVAGSFVYGVFSCS